MTYAGRIDHECGDAVALDLRDRKILTLLSEDARMPLTKVAKQVRLSRDAVAYRIRRMQQSGVLLRSYAEIDYERLGFYSFHIFLLVDELAQDKEAVLVEYLRKHPNVCSVIEYSDRWDFEVVLIARSLREFDRIVLEISGQFPEVILEKDKLEIIRQYIGTPLPPLVPRQNKRYSFQEEMPAPAALDDADLRILRLLSEDCTCSAHKMGEAVGLSADAVAYRIRRMIEEGVIRRCTVLTSFSLLGYYWYTYSVEMKTFNHEDERKLEAFIDENPSIVHAVKTLGGWDLLFYMVAQNPKEFHRCMKRLKSAFANVIRNYQTWIAYKEHVFKPMPEVIGGLAARGTSGTRP